MFSKYSIGVVPHVDVFLYFCGEEGDLRVLLLHHLEGPPQFIIKHILLMSVILDCISDSDRPQQKRKS